MGNAHVATIALLYANTCYSTSSRGPKGAAGTFHISH